MHNTDTITYIYIYTHIYRLLAAYMATGYLPVYISLPKPINHLPFNSEPPHHSVVLTTCLLVASLFFQRPHQSHMSHEKKPPTFHYTGWLIGILIMVYYNPYVTGFYNPLNTLNNQVFFIAHMNLGLRAPCEILWNPITSPNITMLGAIHKPPNHQTLQHLISKWRYLPSPPLVTRGDVITG